jgi:hypothetical protein
MVHDVKKGFQDLPGIDLFEGKPARSVTIYSTVPPGSEYKARIYSDGPETSAGSLYSGIICQVKN